MNFRSQFKKLVLRVSSGVPNTSILIKALGLRPHAFISISVFGTPDETLALVFELLLQELLKNYISVGLTDIIVDDDRRYGMLTFKTFQLLICVVVFSVSFYWPKDTQFWTASFQVWVMFTRNRCSPKLWVLFFDKLDYFGTFVVNK